MAKISCRVEECSHNKLGECYANCVDIVGSSATRESDTCCGSFLNKLHYSELINNTLGLGSCDCLKCTVNSCTFNENHLCTLGSIQVSGDNVEYHSQTECDSFRQKR